MKKYLCTLLVLLFCVSRAHAAGRVFYDNFESGNVNQWAADDYRNKCTTVTSAADGVAGPFAGTRMARCNWNGQVAWNDSASVEVLKLDSVSYTSEIFYRVRVRRDQNLEPTTNSGTKILRISTDAASAGNEAFNVIPTTTGGMMNGVIAGGQLSPTYWGGASGDNTCSSSSWHTIEFYFNAAAGLAKVWHDGIQIRNDSGLNFAGKKWYPFYLTSNWSDAHDATNYVYFDEFEIYSDTGSGATGLMSDATIGGGGGPPPPPPPPDTAPSAPTNLQVN